MLLTGSLVAPLKAIIVNACTIAIAYGTIVFVFQDAHFEGLLRFTSTGAVDAIMPIVMFCALFGVSMDYEVFLLARMHETWHAHARRRRQRGGRADAQRQGDRQRRRARRGGGRLVRLHHASA